MKYISLCVYHNHDTVPLKDFKSLGVVNLIGRMVGQESGVVRTTPPVREKDSSLEYGKLIF